LPEKNRNELVHSRVGEEQVRRIRQQRRRRHDGVPFLAKEIEKRLANFCGSHDGETLARSACFSSGGSRRGNEILRFDELISFRTMLSMRDKLVGEIQRLYPQIYLACHVDNVRASSTKWRLSSRDSSILAHLDDEHGMSPRTLASHLGVAPSTLSAAIRRLAELGYIKSEPSQSDMRQRELRLTIRGTEAMAGTSVLDADRVAAVLELLSRGDRETVLEGLRLFAAAARQLEPRR
jgi:DNA-binding MarR family transcriptional regulator